MNPAETRGVLTVAVLAAFADGSKHERERAEIRRVAEGLSADDAVALPTLVQDVLMKRVTMATALPDLQDERARQLAYEMAVCVCDADGTVSPAERSFLAELRSGLGLSEAGADDVALQAEAMAAAPLTLDGSSSATMASPTALPPVPVSGGAAPSVTRAVDEAALDKAVLDAAILNGALELLPESLSTMAIIPLQMRLVYRIGRAHGYELDSGHIKDFLATAGVGLTSQYLEQAGRKLLGGLLRRVGGGGMIGSVLSGVGQQAVSSGMSFAATYALGELARRYYAGGRTFSASMLKDSYAALVQKAKGLYPENLPAIRERARTLDAGQVLALVRGSR